MIWDHDTRSMINMPQNHHAKQWQCCHYHIQIILDHRFQHYYHSLHGCDCIKYHKCTRHLFLYWHHWATTMTNSWFMLYKMSIQDLTVLAYTNFVFKMQDDINIHCYTFFSFKYVQSLISQRLHRFQCTSRFHQKMRWVSASEWGQIMTTD